MAQRLRWLSLGCPVSRVLKANTLRLRIEGVTERVVSMFWALGLKGFGIRSGLALRGQAVDVGCHVSLEFAG